MLNNKSMDEIMFENFAWNLIRLQSADEIHLCVLVSKGGSSLNNDDTWFWAIYNSETGDVEYIANYKQACKRFLKIAAEIVVRNDLLDNPFQ